jgi:hypothetical protein
MTPKFPRIPHLPFSPEIHTDDKTHALPRLFLNTEVIITEKLDGGNTCLHDGVVYARSTGQPARHGSFDYIKAQHAPRTIGYPEFMFYGENMAGIHSIEYDRLSDFFYLIAIREGDHWLSWDETQEHAAAFSFATVPPVAFTKFATLDKLEAFLADEIAKPSFFGTTREGFTIRLRRGFSSSEFGLSFAKYVRKNHVQTDDEHWSRNWQPATLGDKYARPHIENT